MSRRFVTVAGACSDDLEAAVRVAARAILDRRPIEVAGSVVVAAGSVGLAREQAGVVRQVAALQAARRAASVRIVAPPRLVGSVRRSVDDSRWTPTRLPTGAGRIETVSIPTNMADADALIFVNRLPASPNGDSPVIGVWSRFVPLKLRLGALASGPREGLAAEIALAFRPALIVLAGEVRGIAVVVATDDQVAAELFGLACAALRREDDDPATDIGPWEDPLVQRATELSVGVSLPAEIGVRSVWSSRDGAGRQAFDDLVAGLVTILGIPGPIDRQESAS